MGRRRPSVGYAERPGRWVAEPIVAAARRRAASRLHLRADSALGDAARRRAEQIIGGSQAAGCDAGAVVRLRRSGRRPAGSARRGRALAVLHLGAAGRAAGDPRLPGGRSSRSRPTGRCALVAVRLCDVAPTGSSLLVTRGLLNLTHRDSHEAPEPLEPGQPLRGRVRLEPSAHAFAPGHRIRVSRLADVLAVRVASARARHAHARRRSGEPTPAAGARARAAKTTPCRRSRSRRSRRRSPSSASAAGSGRVAS